MNKTKKLTTFFSLFIFTLIFMFSVAAQNVEVIKYNSENQITPTGSNIYINKYSSDYSFSIGAADKNPSVCICSDSYDKIYITNTAPYEATFTIITSLPEYVSVPYSNIKIKSGQTAEVLLLVSAACGSSQKTLDYNVLVSNNFGTQYTIERELQINRCQSIEATLYASRNTILPCESVLYTVELKNSASFAEQYIVKPKNTQYFDNAKYELALKSGEKAYLNFTYSPECGVYGEKTIGFNIESVNNELTAKLTHNLKIEKAYDFEVSSQENISLCRDDKTSIPISVKNMAGFDNEFYFTLLSKHDFITEGDSFANLSSGEEKTFVLSVAPTSSTKSEQTVEYEVRTKLGDSIYRGKINLQINDCYAVDVNIIADANPELCAGTYTYQAVIENKGSFKERIFLSEDSEYAEVFPSTIVLEPSENQTVSFALSLPDENVRNIPFTIKATLENGKSWEDKMFVSVKKKHDCTFLQYDKQKLYARYGTNTTSFRVRNVGSMEATYDLSYDGTSWIIPETEKLTLKSGESADVNLTLYADDSEAQSKYNFKITATTDNGENYENVMVLKMTDIPLLQKIYNKATTNTCTTITSILILLLGLGVLSIIVLSWKRVRVPLSFKIIALALIALIIIAVLVFKGLPESRYPAIPNADINNSNIIWYEDESKEIDLNVYFYDPDNDTLTFYADSAPQNITINIEGAKATLTPDKDWSGTARIRFIATDNYGGEIESQRITLEVVEVPEFSLVNCYLRNCIYVNAALLILLLALVFLLRTRQEKDKVSRKVLYAGIKRQKGFLYFLDKDGDVSRVPMARKNKKKQTFKKEKVAKTVKIKRK